MIELHVQETHNENIFQLFWIVTLENVFFLAFMTILGS